MTRYQFESTEQNTEKQGPAPKEVKLYQIILEKMRFIGRHRHF